MPNFPSLVNTVSSSDRYGYEGLPPELAAEEQAVNRRQQMAQYLMQQGMQPAQGQMVGRFYVPPSPLQGVAGLAQVLAGAYGHSKADEARKGISGKSQAMLADAMQQYKEASSPVTSEGPRPTAQVMPPPRPGVGLAPQPPQEPQTVALQGPGAPVTTPRTPEEKRQAMMELMLSSHPAAAKTGAMLLQQDQADREHGLQREFLGEQKEKDRQNRIDTTQAQQGQAIVMATLLGANKKDLEELQARHDKEIERIRGEYKTGAAQIAADSKANKASVGESAVDREFAKEYVEFNAAGGYADVEKGLRQLDGSIAELKKHNLTGPIVGRTPDIIRNIVNPKSIAIRDTVEEVVQRNLRTVLGAQFTQKEGENLIKRAYNENQPEHENIARIERLTKQIREAAQAKADASAYFQEHGTLKGWPGRLYKMTDFLTDGADDTQAPTSTVRQSSAVRRYNPATGKIE